MKHCFYIPFLVLMAITYTRVVENYNSEVTERAPQRGPASVEENNEECLDMPSKFNPHYLNANKL